MDRNIYLIHLYDRLSYLACKAHLFRTALYGLLWPGWLYQIFPHYLINGMIFRNDLLKTKRVFSFSLLLSQTFLILREIGQDTIINLHRSCAYYSCQILTKLELTTDFLKILRYHISRKSVQREPSCSMWMDRDMYDRCDEANS